MLRRVPLPLSRGQPGLSPPRWSCYLSYDLTALYAVKARGKAAFLVRRVILVNDALGNGFVDNAHKTGEHFLRVVESERVDSVVELFDRVAHSGAQHLIFKSFLFRYEHSFFC